MIYMREKAAKKRRQDVPVKEERNKSIIEELRSKLMKKSNSKLQQQICSQQADSRKKQNQSKKQLNTANNKAIKYSISKSPKINLNDNHFSQSIIIHEAPENANPQFSKKASLSTAKCFDIQILNDLSASRYRAQAYIQLLQRERDQKSKQVASLKQQVTQPKDLQGNNEIQALKTELNEKTLCLKKYHKYFEQGKNLYLSVAMELIDSKNELNIRLSQQRKRQKQKSISQCIERIEKFVSIYSNFLAFAFKKESQQILTIDQLWNNVKYHEKIISLLKENQVNSQLAKYHHQNSLLRYQINRLSQHNQQLLSITTSQQRSNSYNNLPIKNEPRKSNQQSQNTNNHHFNSESIMIEDYYEPSQIEQQYQQQFSQISQQNSKEETPFQRLDIKLSPSPIQHPFSTSQMDHLMEVNAKIEKEVGEYKNRIGILQVQKQYILDELQTLQKNNSEIQKQLRLLSAQNSALKQQIDELKVSHIANQNSYEVSKEAQKVLEEQNELLKEKIKLMFKPNGKQTATVEELLKLLNRKQLSNYHQALMELISRYELRISGLTDDYLYERQLKQYSLDFCIPLFNYAQSKEVRIDQIIKYIRNYSNIMGKLKQNEIDVYLRKIKAYSIGVDKQEIHTIKEQLKDYVYQLQIRLPTLSQDSEEDCNSVAGSLTNSASN